MNSKKIEFAVGIFVIIGIAAFMMLALKVSSINQLTKGESYNLIARFDNVGSLKVRSAVKIGGVLIGRVGKIELESDTISPLVTLVISLKYANIPTETSASITTAGLLGEQYISLAPGVNEELLVDGSEIEDTQSALVLEELIGQFMFSEKSSDL